MRRSRIRIIMDILEVIEREGAARLTHILYGANLSYDRLVRYLEELEGKGLLKSEMRGDARVYRLTSEGAKLLHELRRVERLARAFGVEL
ncbi:MAG: hypothetical protein DRK00_03780 [Thermoprotei archaeon]|nr:MAG: hypothetical protein DRK00_03780 [Thermoprotei archaeon]